ncbi:MAG: ATP-binding protein [Solirubrobacterales bacterium]
MSGVVLSWSGGKDSALALSTMREQGVEPTALLTTFTEDYGRVSMHAVRRELLEAQAAAVGVPLIEVLIPAACVNEVYEERMAAVLDSPPLAEVEEFAFADLFLEDIRAYREERLATVGRRASFPIWGRETAALAETFVDVGFEATLVCVDPKQLHASFCGRAFDADLLRDLPEGADPCGENGEFHTFVTAGPIFSAPVPVEGGETVERDGFVFHDLLPA